MMLMVSLIKYPIYYDDRDISVSRDCGDVRDGFDTVTHMMMVLLALMFMLSILSMAALIC